jgi:hypothetical protein
MVACQLDGRMEVALRELQSAEDAFSGQGDARAAASVQVSTLVALAMLGRYE